MQSCERLRKDARPSALHTISEKRSGNSVVMSGIRMREKMNCGAKQRTVSVRTWQRSVRLKQPDRMLSGQSISD